jgi:EAL domain-containing protein (putative c-di-GMP-specific phosphodiesterase class I)
VNAGDDAALRGEVEACIAAGAFTLVYQPIVHLDGGTVAGAEALSRFNDGAQTERRFQQAERLGLSPDLDMAIIERILAELEDLDTPYVSINLSPSTLLDERLADVLLASGVPGEDIVIEVTEHARISDYAQAERQLAAIRAAGIRLAVDDAGAGYATFRHILSLRPDIIKMDRSITQDIDSDAARRALATALVIFGGELGATVIAEGIETQSEILALRRAGIHRGQGYSLARPQPPPIPDIDYTPLPLAELLNLPALPSESTPSTPTEAEAISAHRLLASIDAIRGVLDMLNERLATIGETRYRGLVGTAQRQAHHVEGALRAMARGLPGDAGVDLSEPAPAPTPTIASEAADADADGEREPDRARARRRLQAAADALAAAQDQLADTVALARKAGVTWDETAQVLGMTRQGATKRYGRGRNT